MPTFLEKRLRASARRKGYKGAQVEHYVYGAMNNLGAMRGNRVTKKGEAMQRKHDRDSGAHEALRQRFSKD